MRWAFLLITFGVIELLQHIVPGTPGWGTLWPVLIIAWGAGIVAGRIFRRVRQ